MLGFDSDQPIWVGNYHLQWRLRGLCAAAMGLGPTPAATMVPRLTPAATVGPGPTPLVMHMCICVDTQGLIS